MLKMENLPFSSPHSKETVQRSHCVSPSYQKLCYVRAWAGSLIYGGDCRLIPQLHTIYYTGIKTGTADGWSAWLQVSRLLCGLHHHTWQFFYYAALQVSKPAQNIRPILHNCPVSKSWIQALSEGLLPCKTHSEHTWLKFLCCLFFLTAGTLSCKLSFVGWFCSPQLLCTLQLSLAGSLATVCWMSKWFQTAAGTCLDTWGID